MWRDERSGDQSYYKWCMSATNVTLIHSFTDISVKTIMPNFVALEEKSADHQSRWDSSSERHECHKPPGNASTGCSVDLSGAPTDRQTVLFLEPCRYLCIFILISTVSPSPEYDVYHCRCLHARMQKEQYRISFHIWYKQTHSGSNVSPLKLFSIVATPSRPALPWSLCVWIEQEPPENWLSGWEHQQDLQLDGSSTMQPLNGILNSIT